jgi:hypothetical protein
MAIGVKSAAEATEIATAFLKKHYFSVRPISAVKDNDIWTVKVDVGVLTKDIAKVTIDASTAEIREYSLPE